MYIRCQLHQNVTLMTFYDINYRTWRCHIDTLQFQPWAIAQAIIANPSFTANLTVPRVHRLNLCQAHRLHHAFLLNILESSTLQPFAYRDASLIQCQALLCLIKAELSLIKTTVCGTVSWPKAVLLEELLQLDANIETDTAMSNYATSFSNKKLSFTFRESNSGSQVWIGNWPTLVPVQ